MRLGILALALVGAIAAPANAEAPPPPAAAELLDDLVADGPDAFERVRAAVEARPDDGRTRFVLACAHARRGELDAAIAELKVLLAQPACPECADALGNVNLGGRLNACGFDLRARARVGGRAPSLVRAFTVALVRSFNTGDATVARRFLDAHRTVSVTSRCGACADTARTRTWTRADVIAFIGGAQKRYEENWISHQVPPVLFCDDRCCRGPRSGRLPSRSYVLEVCFHPGARPTLASVEIIDGGGHDGG